MRHILYLSLSVKPENEENQGIGGEDVDVSILGSGKIKTIHLEHRGMKFTTKAMLPPGCYPFPCDPYEEQNGELKICFSDLREAEGVKEILESFIRESERMIPMFSR